MNAGVTALLERMLFSSPDFRARAAATRVLCYWRDRVTDSLEIFKKRVPEHGWLMHVLDLETMEETRLAEEATFDLIGLPPTPEEMDAFLADDSPDAFQRVVDRLFESKHYGERMAQHWANAVVRMMALWPQ